MHGVFDVAGKVTNRTCSGEFLTSINKPCGSGESPLYVDDGLHLRAMKNKENFHFSGGSAPAAPAGSLNGKNIVGINPDTALGWELINVSIRTHNSVSTRLPGISTRKTIGRNTSSIG